MTRQKATDDEDVFGLGSASALAPQISQLQTLQNAAAANGNGTAVDASGCNGAQQVEIIETAGGTATVTLQGSMDGTHWYTVGYQQVDATAALARVVSGISVTANSAHVYQLLDPYRQIRAVISSIANSAAVTVRAYLVPA